MTNCTKCNRKPTAKRKLNNVNVCSDCVTAAAATNVDVEIPSSTIDDEKCIGDITFGEFRTWLSSELRSMVRSVVQEELKDIHKDIEDLKSSEKKLKERMTKIETKAGELETTINGIKESNKPIKSGMENNLKYLINLDRNQRRHSVILFGVREDENLQIGTKEADNDRKKSKLLLEYIGCNKFLTPTDWVKRCLPINPVP